MFFGGDKSILNKAKHVLYSANQHYKKKHSTLSSKDRSVFESGLESLQAAIEAEDAKKAEKLADEVEAFVKEHFPNKATHTLKEVVIALVFALSIALVARQMWFELYVIPTGSMRPTFKEQDRLLVSKTQFGLNIPLKTDHFAFNPDNVKRTGVVIWSGDGVDLPDVDDIYFNLIPYKKRFIKRMIGKPGDSLYFYGGKIYGVDAEGNDVPVLRDAEWMQPLEHIPMITFEGKTRGTIYSEGPIAFEATFNHANIPVGRVLIDRSGKKVGEIGDGDDWVLESTSLSDDKSPTRYADFFGIGNYAQARILRGDQLQTKGNGESKSGYYLELRHNPSLTYPEPIVESDFRGHFRANLAPHVSVIPLSYDHMEKIMDAMYTCRFVVKRETATRYMQNYTSFSPNSPKFEGVEDGTYELYYGKGWKIGFGGNATELSTDHPLMNRDMENIQKLFNLGIEMNTLFSPQKNQRGFPTRFAYFRDGSLYVMGHQVIDEDDTLLKEFIEKETKKEQLSKGQYVAFIDRGAPLNDDGSVDVELIQKRGLYVPEGHYFVLGDNHAMSLDGRSFGFVPQQNIQGVPERLIWPFGERWGSPPQVDYPTFTIYRLFMWAFVTAILVILYMIHKKRMQLPIYQKID